MAVILPWASRTRVLIAAGAKPPVSTMLPALLASSPSLAMASISSLGGGPECLADLTSIMKRIVGSPDFDCGPSTRRSSARDTQALLIDRTQGAEIDSRQSFLYHISTMQVPGIHLRFLPAISAKRALTSFLMRAAGGGLSV